MVELGWFHRPRNLFSCWHSNFLLGALWTHWNISLSGFCLYPLLYHNSYGNFSWRGRLCWDSKWHKEEENKLSYWAHFFLLQHEIPFRVFMDLGWVQVFLYCGPMLVSSSRNTWTSFPWNGDCSSGMLPTISEYVNPLFTMQCEQEFIFYSYFCLVCAMNITHWDSEYRRDAMNFFSAVVDIPLSIWYLTFYPDPSTKSVVVAKILVDSVHNTGY